MLGTLVDLVGLLSIMKKEDYQMMLIAVNRALEVCEQSSGFMDQVHREICENLKETKLLLLRVMNLPEGDPMES